MAKEFAKAFYKSKAWQRCRYGYIRSVYGQCERCDKPGLILHHKIKLTIDNINIPEITLNWDHLEYVCQHCHNKEHHGTRDDVIRDGLMFDEYGNIVEFTDD